MSRRTSLPGAAEFFRPTSTSEPVAGTDPLRAVPALPAGEEATASPPPAGPAPRVGSSGRQRHDEKITVYVSAAELMTLEQARLTLRGSHALAVDRGRIVREALAVVLADLDRQGADSILVRRLREG